MQDEQQTNEDEIKPIIEEKSWETPDYIFIPKGNHLWRQEGYFLICGTCDLNHASFIGKDRIMVGEKDGNPIIKKRSEIGIS